ncbi:MAG TPA: AtpZ/AtpI family protein [Dongiaceae bacterium]|nr:AtpZ/AtpI family protein [Dongiaceae bacterium]
MPSDDRPPLADAFRYVQAGTVLIAPMIALGGLGWWADARFGTGPWVMVAGLLLGMAGGFVNFLQLVLPKRGDDGRGGDSGGPRAGDSGTGDRS